VVDILCCSGRLKELEEQYAKEKMEHERLFAQQREVSVGFEQYAFTLDSFEPAFASLLC